MSYDHQLILTDDSFLKRQRCFLKNVLLGCVILCIVILNFGCSSGPQFGTASGSVSYEGKPAKGGIITFMSKQGGIPVAVQFDEDGKYTAENIPVGPVMISIDSLPDESGDIGQKAKESGKSGSPTAQLPKKSMKYPEKYLKFETSGLSTTVKPTSEGVTKFDVTMTK